MVTADAARDTRDSQPWTAARCHRLLRQLESRLATLKKLVSEVDSRATPTRGTLKRLNLDEDQEPSKRIRYTYSSRKRKSKMSPKHPYLAATPRLVRTLGALRASRAPPISDQQVSFPTPAWRKFQGQYDHKKSHGNETEVVNTTPRNLVDEVRSLRNVAPEGHHRIYVAIFDWLGAFLQSTEIKGQEPHPKSLLGMCLRKVPACVQDIEDWEKEVTGDWTVHSTRNTSHVSREIYGQLEAFGAANFGWRPLKQTVRWHALSFLRRAISEGLFQPAYVALLVRLCTHLRCIDEAACLATAISGTLPAPRNAQSCLEENSRLQPLHALLTSTTHGKNKRRGAAFDSVSNLIKEKRLPSSWISVKGFSTVLTSAVEAITVADCDSPTVEFLVTALEMLCLGGATKCWVAQGYHRQQTLIRVVAGLATATMNVADDERSQATPQTRKIRRRLFHALNSGIARVRLRQRTTNASDIFIIALARHLAGFGVMNGESELGGCHEQVVQEGLDRLGGDPPGSAEEYYRRAMYLVCSIAHGLSRVRACSGHESLSDVCDKLGGLALPAWFRQGLRVDGGFLLAQKTNDLRDLAFAEREVQPETLQVSTTPAPVSTIFSGWRWEEGIGEWVKRSPGLKKVTHGRGNVALADTAPHKTRPQIPRHPQQTDILRRLGEDNSDGCGSQPGRDPRTSVSSVEGTVLPSLPGGQSLTGKQANKSTVDGHARTLSSDHGPSRSKGTSKGTLLKGTTASAPPIGRRRQLVIVRGPAQGRARDDVHWLD